MATFLINFATRSRPEKFFNCLDNLRHTSSKKNYFVLAKCDMDDDSMNNDSVRDRLKYYPEVQVEWGISENKVHAINRDIEKSLNTWKILMNHSDDMWMAKDGWDEIIESDMNKFFPDLGGVLHYNDGNHYGNKLMTYSIMGKKYFDRFGYVYYPGYANVYCDNEAMEVAKKLNKYVYIPDAILNHNHPMWGKAEWDDQYKKTEEPIGYKKDREIYTSRVANNFGL